LYNGYRLLACDGSDLCNDTAWQAGNRKPDHAEQNNVFYLIRAKDILSNGIVTDLGEKTPVKSNPSLR